jgi:hypothetical protein
LDSIGHRIAQKLKTGMLVNLDIGIPTVWNEAALCQKRTFRCWRAANDCHPPCSRDPPFLSTFRMFGRVRRPLPCHKQPELAFTY